MDDKYSFKSILLGVILVLFVSYICLTFKPIERKINHCYQVYLGGEKIGLTYSKDELDELIDKEQQEIKEKYNVSKVYSPKGLDVREVSTYNNNILTSEEIYEEIKDLDSFTIEGYEVNINVSDDKKISFYILNKEDLDKAIRNTVLAFVDEEDYNKYLNGEQEVKDEGKEITNIYLNNEITIKKTYVPADADIITDLSKLNMYFLFGNTNLQKKYTVKATDTIESIAEKNKLGVQDFLVANPDIVGENALLAVGQEVTVAPINPLSGIVVESFETEYQTMKYETKTEFDKTLNADQTYVKQQGSNGLAKVTFATKELNGRLQKTAQVSNEVIRPTVDRIIVYGAKNVIYYGNTTYWAWPTVKPFRKSDGFGWRILEGKPNFHKGIDITGTAKKDIYAIQSGKVIQASKGWNGGYGNVVKIDHGNGYVSTYGHLSKILVKKGAKVDKGQLIGMMGNTGLSFGTHLHLVVEKHGNLINPYTLYK